MTPSVSYVVLAGSARSSPGTSSSAGAGPAARAPARRPCANADLLEHQGDGLRELLVVQVNAVAALDLDVHAVREAGLGQELLGPRRIVRIRLDLRVEAEVRVRDAAADGNREALVELLDDLVLVDGVVQRLAELDVRQGALLRIDQVHRHEIGQRVLDAAASGLLDLGHEVRQDLGDELRLVAGERGHAGEVVGDGPPRDLLDLGHAAPVVAVRLEHDAVVLDPLDELVGAGADRL